MALVAGTTGVVVLPGSVASADLNVATISAGQFQTCAVTAGGAAECWGAGVDGELGNGEHGNSVQALTPTTVTGLGTGVASVAAGYDDACALTTGGGVKCWGWFGYGELGNGTTTGSDVPVDVSGLGSGVAAITADGPQCALTDAGAVKCWGDNTAGELGDGATDQPTVPVAVNGLGSGVAAISAGIDFVCALTNGGAVKCWGGNDDGELGDGTTTQRNSPVTVSGLGSGVVAISARDTHTCALLSSGAVECWGVNEWGQLGDGTANPTLVPVTAAGPGSGVVSLAAGGDHTCAVTTGGAAECWGRNSFGELGDASLETSHSPVAVAGLGSGVAVLSGGYTDACALTTNGAVSCWGYNQQGELGDGLSGQVLTPVGVSGLSAGVAAIGEGSDHTCAIQTGGALECWGLNGHGQLGDGTTLQRDAPVPVIGLGSNVVAVVGGDQHTCALTAAGAVKCWGFNAEGQLGDGTNLDRHTPVDVVGLDSGVASLSAWLNSTCAVLVDGTAKCWGADNGGLLGDGATTSENTPVAVTTVPADIAALDVSLTSCALDASGGVKCWGCSVGSETARPEAR